MKKLTGGSGWSLSPDDEPRPAAKKDTGSPAPKIRLEKRTGKYVTVIAGLHTYGAERLNAMARELKASLGAGGTVKNGVIEIQGDKLEAVRSWFDKKKKQ